MTDHYQRGLDAGRSHEQITIALNGTWGGRGTDCMGHVGHTTSYEKIGYHAGSVAFLQGVLDSGCPVIQYYEHEGRLCKRQIHDNPWLPNPPYNMTDQKRKVRQAIRAFLLVATDEELETERQLSLRANDTFRAACVMELQAEIAGQPATRAT